MTITEILAAANVKLSQKDKSKLGHIIGAAAKQKGIAWVKKPEMIQVNDYPELFTEDMKELVITFLMDAAANQPILS